MEVIRTGGWASYQDHFHSRRASPPPPAPPSPLSDHIRWGLPVEDRHAGGSAMKPILYNRQPGKDGPLLKQSE